MQGKKARGRVLHILRSRRNTIYLLLIFVCSFYFRVYNTNWDNNYYFHPDERAIIMFTTPLALPKNIPEFFSTNSPLNPHFFAYGSLPIYTLKIAGEVFGLLDPTYKVYGGIHVIGRTISALLDSITVLFIYLIGGKLATKRVGLLGALLYSVSVLPIQLAHFYAVDTMLTLFMTATIYFLLRLFEKPTIAKSLLVGFFLGLSLATKVSALVLIPSVFFAFGYFLFISRNKKQFSFAKLLLKGVVLLFTATAIFALTQPYVIIDFSEFIVQTKLQSQMSSNAFIFPYTLQYVGKIPYLHELKNIFLWGQGPIVAAISFLGLGAVSYLVIRKSFKNNFYFIVLLLYTLSYILIFGNFAVGWMRYMLPIYPLLSVFGGVFIGEIVIPGIPKKYLAGYFFRKGLLFIFCILLLIYPISYQNIYSHLNTRITASNWINKNIPFGSTLAVEHWDDSLPVFGYQNYIQLTLPLYEPDTPQKWQNIHTVLNSSKYIIIASNRLYVPLQKLTNCKALPVSRCYPQTAEYYKNLFSGNLGFRKIAEFTSYPTIPVINLPINDDNADESFTVIDHPKIMIFKQSN